MDFIFGIATLVISIGGLYFGLSYLDYLVLKFQNNLNKKIKKFNKKEGE